MFKLDKNNSTYEEQRLAELRYAEEYRRRIRSEIEDTEAHAQEDEPVSDGGEALFPNTEDSEEALMREREEARVRRQRSEEVLSRVFASVSAADTSGAETDAKEDDISSISDEELVWTPIGKGALPDKESLEAESPAAASTDVENAGSEGTTYTVRIGEMPVAHTLHIDGMEIRDYSVSSDPTDGYAYEFSPLKRGEAASESPDTRVSDASAGGADRDNRAYSEGSIKHGDETPKFVSRLEYGAPGGDKTGKGDADYEFIPSPRAAEAAGKGVLKNREEAFVGLPYEIDDDAQFDGASGIFVPSFVADEYVNEDAAGTPSGGAAADERFEEESEYARALNFERERAVIGTEDAPGSAETPVVVDHEDAEIDYRIDHFDDGELDETASTPDDARVHKDSEQREMELDMERFLRDEKKRRSTDSSSDGGVISDSEHTAPEPEPFNKKALTKKSKEESATDIALISARIGSVIKTLEFKLDMTEYVFTKPSGSEKRDSAKTVRELKKAKNRLKRAIKYEKADNKRYYSFVLTDLARAKLPKGADMGEIIELRSQLMSLLSLRDEINQRLVELYTGSPVGKKSRSDARLEENRRARRREFRRQAKLEKRMQRGRVEFTYRDMLHKLMDRQVLLSGNIAEFRYILKREKPKGDAKKELKRKLKDVESEYNRNKRDIRRIEKKAFTKASDRKNKSFAAALGWIGLVLLCTAVGVVIWQWDAIYAFVVANMPWLLSLLPQ